jgi:hypothetical protein
MKATVWTIDMEDEFTKLKDSLFHSQKPLNVFSDEVENSPQMKRYNELMIHRQAHVKKLSEKKSKNSFLFSNNNLN